jgi:hypothetical protein
MVQDHGIAAFNRHYVVAGCQLPTLCPRVMYEDNVRALKERPPIGGNLMASTLSQDADEWTVTTKICSSHRETGPLSPCTFTSELHPKEACLCIH